jgi:hypothetical protein
MVSGVRSTVAINSALTTTSVPSMRSSGIMMFSSVVSAYRSFPFSDGDLAVSDQSDRGKAAVSQPD